MQLLYPSRLVELLDVCPRALAVTSLCKFVSPRLLSSQSATNASVLVDSVHNGGSRRLQGIAGHVCSLGNGGNLGLLCFLDSLLGGWLLVGGEVEHDEQNQIRGENDTAGESSHFLAFVATGSGVRQPWSIGVGEIRVASKVDEA